MIKFRWGKFGNSDVSDFFVCIIYLLTVGVRFVIVWVHKNQSFEKVQFQFDQISLRKVWKFRRVRFFRLHYLSTNCGGTVCNRVSSQKQSFEKVQFQFDQISLRKVWKFRRVRFFRLHYLSTNCGGTVCNRVSSQKSIFRKISIWFQFETRWGKFGNSNMSEDLAPFSNQKVFD